MLLHPLSMSSALPNHHHNSSSSLVVRSIYQLPLQTIFIPLEYSLRLFNFSGNHTKVSSSPLADIISHFSSYTLKCNSSPLILFKFICTIELTSLNLTFISLFRHFDIRHFAILHVANSCCKVSRLSKFRSPKFQNGACRFELFSIALRSPDQ
jgi:hypothetical protein